MDHQTLITELRMEGLREAVERIIEERACLKESNAELLSVLKLNLKLLESAGVVEGVAQQAARAAIAKATQP